MPSEKQLAALAGFAGAAVRSERLYGVPAELSVAQAVVESAWGAKMPANNCFGIKASAHHTASCSVTTHEVFTAAQLAEWRAKHPGRPVRLVKELGGGKQLVELDDDFASYCDLGACFEDHAAVLLEPPFRAMLDRYHQSENLFAYVHEVGKRYATDPTYGKLLLSIISGRSVQDALRAARAQAAK